MGFSSEVLEIEVSGHVATLWLDREAKRNALGRDFWADLPRAADELAELDDLRAVVLAARGPHFTVGLDLKEMGGALGGSSTPTSPAVTNYRTYRNVRRMQDAITAIEKLPVPVISAIHGYCIGGGVDLICATDIRLASSDAVFSVREAKIAIVADMGTLQRLPRLIAPGHVAELAYTAKDIDAARAEEIGLVNHVHAGSADEVYQGALALAEEIAANPPLAVQGTKAVLAANEGRTIDQGLDFVAQWNAAYIQTNDLAEAMSAFLEKRPANFSGS